MQRIVVIGSSGAGKSTLAGKLAQKLNYPYIELDQIFFQPNWDTLPMPVFAEKVADRLAKDDRWVVCGNYSEIRAEIIWKRADTLVWLDYPLSLCLWRAVMRSLRRIRTQEIICNGNTESWQRTFFSRASVLLWILRTHASRQRDYTHDIASPLWQGKKWIRLNSPAAAKIWMESVGERAAA